MSKSIQLNMSRDIVVGFWQSEAQRFNNKETVMKFHDVTSKKPEELLDDYKAIRRILDSAIDEIENGGK